MDLRERPSALTARHPWETVRAGFFCRLLSEPLASRQPVHVLDVGAGDGFVAGQLAGALPPGSSVTCLDAGYSDDQIAALRGGAGAGALEFARSCPDRTFDAIVLLDVLEHVADDRGFLGGFVDRLRPGGLVLASVPAHQALFTQHDVALGHHRRYAAHQLRALLTDAGLALRTAGSLFGSLVIPRALGVLVERVRGVLSRPSPEDLAAQIATGITDWQHGALVTGAVRGALELDARLCALAARWSAPSLGLSVWALAQRA